MAVRVVGACLLCGASAAGASDQVDFVRDIRPILVRNCFSCHGPDDGTREAGLRLDEREAALTELESGFRAIVPEHPDQSELLTRLTASESLRMPPPETGRQLTAEQISLLERWIQQGAKYDRHWSFEPIANPAVPEVENSAWVRNEIDRFILHRLERERIQPSPEADRPTLIRRLSLDLIGLPPSVEEVDRFLQDDQPGAYERVVDRLLQSPHFGERWGRHWLDLARYADSDGYLGDHLRPSAYRYRDWVIDSFNRDLPFDEFTIQQIAGDLLGENCPDGRIASGFHRNSMKNTEAGADRELDRVVRTKDRTSTLGTVWLGLTVGCAECHSHKFEPISHAEFYQLYAFFNNLEDVDIPAPTPKELQHYERKLKTWTAKYESIRQQVLQAFAGSDFQSEVESVLKLAASGDQETDQEDEGEQRFKKLVASVGKERGDLLESYEQLVSRRPKAPSSTVAAVGETQKRRNSFIHQRGDFRSPGLQVQPATPAMLHPLYVRGKEADRLDLARWLVDQKNPLTARVAVNRIWKPLFGRGIVPSLDNLGISGEPPSHPELLDWLATDFMNHGWSQKQLIRKIVTSSAYRQSSAVRPELRQIDPANTLVARQLRFRLEAEIVRDVALSTSGLLARHVGGPSIRPPLNSRVTAISRNTEWEVSEGPEKYRRGIYVLFRRATPYPMLTMFDAPDTSVSCAQRERSNSPLQALTLLNDPVFFECAVQFGSDLNRLPTGSSEEWITVAFRRALARQPLPEELSRLVALHDEYRQQLQQLDPQEIEGLVGANTGGREAEERAARIMIARSLMNLDEFITRE